MFPVTNQVEFLGVLPWVFLAAIAVAATVFFIFLFARRFGPAVEGQNRGNFQIIGIDSDRNIRLDITGAVIETPRFLNATNKVPAKMFLEDVTQQRLSTLRKDEQNNKAEITACNGQLDELKKFSADDMAKMCRVYVVRNGMEKHVLLQWHHVEKSLENYACIKTRSKFSLSFGFVVQGQIQGWVKTEKTYEGNIPGFGRFSLHYFDPMFTGSESPVDPPSWLGAVMLYVPTTVELHDEIKSKDAQILNLKRARARTALDLTEAKTESDFDTETVENFGIKDAADVKKAKRLDLLDFGLIAGPTFVLSLIAQSLNASPFYGMFVGFFAGAVLVSLKRR